MTYLTFKMTRDLRCCWKWHYQTRHSPFPNFPVPHFPVSHFQRPSKTPISIPRLYL